MIELKQITKSFEVGKETIDVLKGIDLRIQAGESVAIMGQIGRAHV